MTKLKENHLEWAHKHLQKFSHSDFYPRLFECSAITHNWPEVKSYLLSLDLDEYEPKSPMINLAPKPNGNFRVVHQLDPIDSLIYTSLIYEVCEVIEKYRIPESEKIVCSYRIKPDLEGSFFSGDTGWDTYIARTNQLSDEYDQGYVIIADITDFYNQIYTHRINSLIVEAGKGAFDEQAKIIENFLLSLNKKTSRGIPVGPRPSIILAELIMGSIDKKIRNFTSDFVRYVDDIRMFFKEPGDAIQALHELTYYLYTYHRLVFSGEKTKVLSVKKFKEEYLSDEKKKEKAEYIAKADELANKKIEELLEKLPPYGGDFNYNEVYEKTLSEIFDKKQFELLSSTYLKLFKDAISMPIDYGMLRHLLRQSTRYRIRNILPIVLEKFYYLRPVIREAVIYLNAVINEETILKNKAGFEKLLSSFFIRLPFINIWVSCLLQNECMNKIGLTLDYEYILSKREQALIAVRQNDTTWDREYRDKMDVLSPWEKRAVLYSNKILPYDEMKPLVQSVAASGDIIEKSIASYLISKNKPSKTKKA
jgi:hypothetical protein